jgi:hypothetical protein
MLPSAPTAGHPARTRYRERADHFRALERSESARSRTLSLLRLATFVGVVGSLLVAERAGASFRAPALTAAALLILVFGVLLVHHRRVRRREAHARTLAQVNEEGLVRHRRAWDELPPEPWGSTPAAHPEAEDLNLVGRASLLRLLAPPSTVPGRSTLTAWLMEAAEPAVLQRRQAAVRALAPLVDLRDELAARGRELPPGDEREVTRFLEWAEGDRALDAHRPLVVAAWILPALTLGLAWGAQQAGLPPLWLLPLAATLWLGSRAAAWIHPRFDAAGAGEGGVRRFDPLLALLATLPAEEPALDGVRAALSAEGPGTPAGDRAPAHLAIARLRRRLDLSEVRRSMLGPVLQYTLLWDVHALAAIEAWQRAHGGQVRGWMAALGEAEALAALARLTADHPEWAFPTASQERVVRGRALGHPLLPPEACTRNDVEVGPPGTLLLITGSNMSGKSTLLRAIGANAALAGAGGPVCAEEFSLPRLRIGTCMRVQDALDEGVSLFMAELRRLRQVVELARREEEEGWTVLYLLDEILQGTNSAERQVAARTILRHLLRAGAIGAVTTHDLALADAPELRALATQVHFRESVYESEGGTVLTFDHLLRPGPATSRNALRLLEAVGLGEGDHVTLLEGAAPPSPPR